MMVRLMITSSQFEWGMILSLDALDKGFFWFYKYKGGRMIDEQGKIRIIVILNHLKEVINPSLDNDIYQ